MKLSGQIRRYIGWFLAIIGLVVISIPVALYITQHERLRFPWDTRYHISARFISAQAVTPGQGQNVEIAGVKVGEITSVELNNGVAKVGMDIDPGKLKHVYTNAHMLLRPKTGLNDMEVELDPGRPPAPAMHDGDTLPEANTQPNVNADEVLAALDSDTRDYFATLINQGGRTLNHRGLDLRTLMKASQPTLARTARITAALSNRHAELARLIHNLRLLSQSTVSADSDIGRLVEASNASLGAIAQNDGALRQSLDRLPGTLHSARQALVAARGFSDELGPALTALRPSARRLAPALVALRPLLSASEPILRRQIRPLVRAAKPVVRDLAPTLADLHLSNDRDLLPAFKVLVYVVNELAYNPPGKEEGYLFWLGWFNHNADSLLSVQDAHGVAWRGLIMASCSSLPNLPHDNPLLAIFFGSAVCPPNANP